MSLALPSHVSVGWWVISRWPKIDVGSTLSRKCSRMILQGFKKFFSDKWKTFTECHVPSEIWQWQAKYWSSFVTWWKMEGRPEARKMVELFPACIQNRSKRRERAIRPPRIKKWVCFWHRGLGLASFTEPPRAVFSLHCLSVPAGSRRAMEVGCLSCLAMETQETNHCPRVWCHGGHVGTLEEPLILAVLQESADLHPDRKGLHLSGLLCSNFNLFNEVAELFSQTSSS